MAFFGSPGGPAGGSVSGAGGASDGPDLPLIQTEGLGFLSLSGDAKLQLTSKWSQLPAPTASLLAIASRKGLVAAAGPDSLLIATTESVRKGFEAPKVGDSEVRPFKAEITLPLPLRISQLAFTADEQYLIVSAEVGGGLAIYDVQALSGGSTKAAAELSTNGETLRALVPNPTPVTAELCAVVTNNGNLMMANLKQGALVTGRNGPALLSNVSCAAWSSKGKQLVAGLADGSIVQITPDGEEKARIPKPAKLGDYHVSTIVWLENNVFLVVHNPTSGGGQSAYHLITRQLKPSLNFVFQKLSDPIEPFSEKMPHHSILRLRDFPPNLQDLLIVASTSVENIGLFTRSKSPLTSSVPADQITDMFTTTELADDSKRAQLPMAEDYKETFPVGTALDFSSKAKVYKPIPTDEMDESPGPLPGLWVLNNDGVLVSWWIVYNESIRQGTIYPGLAIVEGGGAPQPPSVASPKSVAFGAPSSPAPSFGSPSARTPAPAFGAAPALGASQSPWGTAPAATGSPGGSVAFGTSAFGSGPAPTAPTAPKFGSTSAFGASSFGTPSAPSFGQASTMGLGMRTSPWAAGSPASTGPAFGKSSLGGTPAANPFASKDASDSSPSGGGFASFASKGGFATASKGASESSPSGGGFASFASKGGFATASKGASESSPSGSGFAGFASKGGFATASKGASESSPSGSGFDGFASKGGFGSLMSATPGTSVFGSAKPSGAFSTRDVSMGSDTAFPPPVVKAEGPSPLSSTPFVLGTTFRADAASANDNEDPKDRGGSLFGGGFGLSLGDAPTPAAEGSSNPKSIFGSAAEGSSNPKSIFGSATEGPSKPKSVFDSTTPTTTPAPGKFFNAPSDVPSTSGNSLFGFPQPSKPAKSLFGKQKESETIPEDAPLPPETISKAAFPLGESSSSSGTAALSPTVAAKMSSNSVADDDAPLPPMPSLKARAELAVAKVPGATSSPSTQSKVPAPPSNPFAQLVKPKTEVASPAAPLENPFAPKKSTPAAQELPNPFANKLPPPLPSDSDSAEEDDLSEEAEGEEDDEADENYEAEEGDESGEHYEAEEENESGEADEAEEGLYGDDASGTDVANDLSPTTTGFGHCFSQTPGLTPQGSWAGMGGSTYSATSRAEEQASPHLFGEIGGRDVPRFVPGQQPQSPQSPSPRKGQVSVPRLRAIRSESQRSVSAPGMASQILGAAKKPVANLGMAAARRQSPVPDVNVLEQQRVAAKKQAEEEARLAVDEEYEMLEAQLDAPIVPTLQMAECVYLLGPEAQGGTSIASHNEALYRDINRMVQCLKANSRNLAAFIAGHMGQGRGQTPKKTMEDLNESDEWILCDTNDCDRILTQELEDELATSRAQSCEQAKHSCDDLLKETARLRAMRDDINRVIVSQTDPEQKATERALPLSAEQAAQQNDLRRAFTKFSRQIAEVEGELTLLKARLIAAGAAHGKKGAAQATPTVEAVMRTIAKMTSMVEKRSGDVDVLENHMRRLGLGSSRDGTPTTPQQKRRSARFAPGSTARSLTSSVASLAARGTGTPPRKKMSGYTEAEKAVLRQKRDGRVDTIEELRVALEQKGPVRVGMDEDD